MTAARTSAMVFGAMVGGVVGLVLFGVGMMLVLAVPFLSGNNSLEPQGPMLVGGADAVGALAGAACGAIRASRAFRRSPSP